MYRLLKPLIFCGIVIFSLFINTIAWANSISQSHLSKYLPIFSITYGNGTFVAVGDQGIILTSSNGKIWTLRIREENKEIGVLLSGVIYGNHEFVAVGGTEKVIWNKNINRVYKRIETGLILTSSDGKTWKLQKPMANTSLTNITYGNNKFVIMGVGGISGPGGVGKYGIILTSTDGKKWKVQKSNSNMLNPTNIIYRNGIFIVLDGGKIFTSHNAKTWTQRWPRWPKQNSGKIYGLQGITYANNKFVVLGEPRIILTSTDGKNWTMHHIVVVIPRNIKKVFPMSKFKPIQHTEIYGITYGNNKFVAIGESTEWTGIKKFYSKIILTSSNGRIWSLQQKFIANNYFDGITYGNDKFIIIGGKIYGGGKYGIILTSTDGEKWKIQNFIMNNPHGIIYGNGMFMACGFTTTTKNGFPIRLSWSQMILTSSNGKIWKTYSLPKIFFLDGINCLTSGDKKFVGVGGNGKIFISSNGKKWKVYNSNINNPTNITYGNGIFVVLAGDKIFTSYNAKTWIKQKLGINGSLYGIAYGNHKFVAVGSNGKIITSSDGKSWIQETSPTTKYLFSVAYGNHEFVAVGYNGTILTSKNGKIWTLHHIVVVIPRNIKNK